MCKNTNLSPLVSLVALLSFSDLETLHGLRLRLPRPRWWSCLWLLLRLLLWLQLLLLLLSEWRDQRTTS